MNKTFIIGLMLALLLGACSTRVIESPPEPAASVPAAYETGAVEIANPASQNCIEKGGTLSIEARGDGSQYGICYFEDNRQCEEWALMRGDCPAGGLKVTGYVTPAAQYCVISGGSYAIGAESGADDEQGTCTFKDGSACDVWDFYNGKCSPGQLPAPTAAPPQELRLGQLVFDSTRAGENRDLYLMNADGSSVTRLTEGEADIFAGPWSPDGQRIVYTAYGLTNSVIKGMNFDGSGQSTLSEIPGSDEGFPDWSPDGRRIAFTSRRDGNNEIYLMDADGSNPLRLTDAPGDDFAPSWSPDGTRIAFASDRGQSAGVYDLFIMNADGSGITQLTDDPAIDYSPDWSPDGKTIAFRSHHDGPGDIYVD